MNWRIFVVLPLLLALCNGYKVLFLAPMNAKSISMYMSSFVTSLLNRGHEVTFLTSNSLKHLKLANYTEVLIDPPLNLLSKFKQQDIIDTADGSVFSSILMLAQITKMKNEYTFENANVRKFIKSAGLHFDVIVAEEFFCDGLLMFAHKYNAPIVTISPFGVNEYMDCQQGLLPPSSFVPHYMLPYSDNMSFTQRWYNTIVTIGDWLVRQVYFLPSEEQMAQKYFAHLAPLPPLRAILYNVSIILANSHRAISPPRPSMPNVISIGGAHIKKIEPLPSELKSFLDGAKHGAIYFSLGSNLKSSLLPKHQIQLFLNTFRKLKHRVLWKYEDESLTDIPSNVMIRKWMPQNDVLAHSNVILFISHGGLFGTTEALYYGVPLLLIPFLGDQFRNAQRITAAGYGKMLKHKEITDESFERAINEIISNKSYLEKVKETSAIFKDNVAKPMDEAMFWIEHVAKFKGAKHLKSHAVRMSWFTYLLLDVWLVNLFAIIAVIVILRALIRRLFCKSKSQKDLKKKQK